MKKLLSILLTAVITISLLSATVFAATFKDVSSSHWAYSQIAEMSKRGVIDGYPDGNFYPENIVTRAEFAKIMTVAAGLPISDYSIYFDDLKENAWYIPYINAARYYLNGYSTAFDIWGREVFEHDDQRATIYCPDLAAAREDIAVALVKLKGYSTDGADESILNTMFTDVSSISKDARKYIAVAVERGLVEGYDDGTFGGQYTITRAEATAMLWRAYQYGNDNKEFDIQITPSPTDNKSNNNTDNTPYTTPKPTATPRPTATPKPTVTTKPTAIPELEPTEEPERPYVVDTITNADIDSTWNAMTDDNNNNLYYYDKNKNIIYKLNKDSENTTMILDVSTLELRQDDKFDYETNEDDEPFESDLETNSENIVEYYKDFSVSQLCYDKTMDRLILCGMFTKLTDWYGLEDKTVNRHVIIDITEELKLCDKSVLDNIEVSGGYRYASFTVKNGSNLYKFSRSYEGDFTVYNYYNRLYKFNYNTNSWEVLRDNGDIYGGYIGCHNNAFYIWSSQTGRIVKCELNTKLTLLDINSKENVDVLDFKKMPHTKYGDENCEQIFISDNESIIFYDRVENAIRIIKGR